MLGTDDTAAENAATSLLYAGEQYDSELDQYYLRARYYNPYSGSFNRMDPFAGNNSDPQSLHKYAYCHNNPINAIDPSGELSIAVAITTVFVFSMMLTITGCSSEAPRAKARKSRNFATILKVRIRPVMFLRSTPYARRENVRRMEEEFFHEEMVKTNAYWRVEAGIEFVWTKLEMVERPEYVVLETGREVDRAVADYYNGSSIAIVIPHEIEDITTGMTSRNRTGAAVKNSSGALTFAHELAHILVYTYFPHVYNDPSNLLSPGKWHKKYRLEQLHLNDEHVEKARNKAKRKGWTIDACL